MKFPQSRKRGPDARENSSGWCPHPLRKEGFFYIIFLSRFTMADKPFLALVPSQTRAAQEVWSSELWFIVSDICGTEREATAASEGSLKERKFSVENIEEPLTTPLNFVPCRALDHFLTLAHLPSLPKPPGYLSYNPFMAVFCTIKASSWPTQ